MTQDRVTFKDAAAAGVQFYVALDGCLEIEASEVPVFAGEPRSGAVPTLAPHGEPGAVPRSTECSARIGGVQCPNRPSAVPNVGTRRTIQ